MNCFRQTTVESCLTCCILERIKDLQGIVITLDLERSFFFEALCADERDFVQGHLITLKNRFGIDGKVKCFSSLSDLIPYLSYNPIINVDSYYLGGSFHYPHFIRLKGVEKSHFTILNAWTGESSSISETDLQTAINSLKSTLGFEPIMIYF